MAEQIDRLADRLDQCRDIGGLIFDTVTLGRIGFAAPAACQRVNGEGFGERWRDELPVCPVISE